MGLENDVIVEYKTKTVGAPAALGAPLAGIKGGRTDASVQTTVAMSLFVL